MWLKFKRLGVKVYAATPAGEYAYSDSQGLYEWRHGQRIDHSGGDRQGSSQGVFWLDGPPARPEPKQRGIAEALSRARLN